ncbi:MAG: hypothetical protein IT162_10440 [Bryobacterales bacterium]|nr:hypothetical protein [Bryobacterales bacterium]
MSMTPMFALLAVMAAAFLALLVWRQLVDLHEDDSLHLGDQQTAVVREQADMTKKVTMLDRWSRILGVTTTVYGLALGGYYLYSQWLDSSKLPGS